MSHVMTDQNISQDIPASPAALLRYQAIDKAPGEATP
jgi:hypothetical protein